MLDRLRCLVRGHVWCVGDNWAEQAATFLAPHGSLPIYGMVHDGEYTYAGRRIPAECARCGVRGMAEIRRRHQSAAWMRGGAWASQSWEIAVRGAFRTALVQLGPSSVVIEAVLGFDGSPPPPPPPPKVELCALVEVTEGEFAEIVDNYRAVAYSTDSDQAPAPAASKRAR